MRTTDPSDTRSKFQTIVAWIKPVVFLLVAAALVVAAKRSVERWQIETALLRAQARELMTDASGQADPVRRRELIDDATAREAQIPSLGNLKWHRIAIAAVLYAIGLLPPAWVLHRSLTALDVPVSLRRAVAAQLLGHAGKYIPGKAVVVVLRVGGVLPPAGPSLRDPDRNGMIARATTGVFFETLLMMGVGGLVAGILLSTSPLPVWVRAMAAAMAIGAAIPVCPPVMKWLLGRINKSSNDDMLKRELFSRNKITWRLLAECSLVSWISWVFIGGSFAVLITAIPSLQRTPDAWQIYPVATSAISLGMVLGFASLLPGGAGVREYVSLLVLSPAIGPTQALLAVIAARLLFVIVEALLAVAASCYLRRPWTHRNAI